MSKNLEGKIALVTGGSRGISAAIAKRLPGMAGERSDAWLPASAAQAIRRKKSTSFWRSIRRTWPNSSWLRLEGRNSSYEDRTRPCRARSFQEHHFPNCIQGEQK
jgi:hypothetical protein